MRWLLPLLALLTTSCGLPVCSRSQIVGGLRLKLEITKTQYQEWESIDPVVTITNVGRRPLIVSRTVVSFGVKGEGATYGLYPGEPAHWHVSAAALESGHSIVERCEHLSDGRGAWHLKPGGYTLAARYTLRTESEPAPDGAELPGGEVWTGSVQTAPLRLMVMPNSRMHERLMGMLESVNVVNRDERAKAVARIRALGPDAEAELLLMMLDSRFHRRAHAVIALGELGCHDAAPGLISLLEVDEGHLSYTAARALGQIGDRRASRGLCQLLERCTFDSGKESVLEALIACGRADAAPLVQRYASDPDRGIAAMAMVADSRLTGRDRPRELVKSILSCRRERLLTDDCIRKCVILREMGAYAIDAMVAELEKASEEQDVLFLSSYLRPLFDKGHGQDKILAALIRKLEADDQGARVAALKWLRGIDRMDAERAVVERLSDDDRRVRYYAAEVVGDLRAPSAVKPLLKIMRDHKLGYNATAAEALAKFGDPEIEQKITEEFLKGDMNFRNVCISAFARYGTKSLVPWLEKVAKDDPSKDIRASAVRAASRIRQRD